MGATSVTGVGQGSVEGLNMGSKHYTVGANRVLGPRVVAAGRVTLASGAASVVLPKLGGNASDYIVVITAQGSTARSQAATLTQNTNDTTLAIAGSGTDVVGWAIIRVGLS